MKSILLLNSLVILIMACKTNAQTSSINANEFERAIAQQNIQILDVRTAEEFKTGHLKNALQANWNNQEEFKKRVTALDKNKPVYVYCLAGLRSNAAMEWLTKQGFKNVTNLAGGISAWKKAAKPLDAAIAVKQISLQEYEALIPKDKTVLVDIGATWCPPCIKMNPIIDSLKAENYNVIKIDGGDQTEICKALNIDAFPVFIVYKNGVEVNRKLGIINKQELIQLLK